MNPIKFILSIFICFLPGIIGGIITRDNIYPWYSTLIKPFFSPPNWVFSPVWTTLYFLMALSLFLILNTHKSRIKTQGLIFFSIQLILNGLWSVIFFGMHSIIGALVIIILLLIFILLTAFKFYRLSKTASYLLIPYILWVSYATILNFSLYKLN